ncbi:MAG: hypothetical protein LBB75_02925 [Oscillospiraceae bacterium]|jgi:hypothetical protein|nr:hypothetical protein [Oscillospiraceae bacterium]
MLRKISFMLFSLACFVGAGVCLIVDTAINGHAVWSPCPLLSIAFGWLIFSPLLIKKHGLVFSMGAASLLVAPFLYLLSPITRGGDWFRPVGLPSAAVGVAALWMFYFLFRFAKFNLWYKSAVAVFLTAVAISPAINRFVDIYMEIPPDSLELTINLFTGVAAAAFLAIMGYARQKKHKDG